MKVLNKDVKKGNIDPTRLTKCPICNGELYAYSIMGIMRVESCYCPSCNIVRRHVMSIPYLCSNCYSEAFYIKDGNEYCWYCGNDKMIVMKLDEPKEKGIFDKEGFKISQGRVERKNIDCDHKNMKNRRHNVDMFRFECPDCGDVEYVNVPVWVQEEKNIGDSIELPLEI